MRGWATYSFDGKNKHISVNQNEQFWPHPSAKSQLDTVNDQRSQSVWSRKNDTVTTQALPVRWNPSSLGKDSQSFEGLKLYRPSGRPCLDWGGFRRDRLPTLRRVGRTIKARKLSASQRNGEYRSPNKVQELSRLKPWLQPSTGLKRRAAHPLPLVSFWPS